MPLDSAAIQVASAVTLACSPLPNGVLAISSALKPCSVSMQVTSRVSRSCTRCVSAKVARQFDERALDHARALAQVAGFERRVLRPALLLPQLLALGLEQLGRVAVGQHGAVFLDRLRGRFLGQRRGGGQAAQRQQCVVFLMRLSPMVVVRKAGGSGHHGFVGPRVALVVLPGDRDLVAGLGALDGELQERVLGHGRAPFGR